jgi:branched-chain amino acid transport system substrate-binding protein
LLSLTDENGRDIAAANEILEGIKYAFHEYNSDHSEKIGIVISDIQRDKAKITETANNFIENSDVRCIIGPVFSDDVRNVLKEIDRSNLCLISPTATDDDLVALSEKFYQANPSLTDRGKIFAQYLYYVENKRSLAVLNSIEGYSPLLAASFSQEFERLGGKIAAKETYKSKSFSLVEQMARITAISSLIDGIYAPISDGNDAKAILSQMVQSGLNIDIYGNQDWFLGKGFESSPEISNKLTFDSDYFIDFNDKEFKQFSSLFKKISGMEINRNVLYGYDTAKYILTVLRNIDPTRKNIKYKMESGISVTGFHNNISFDIERSNKFINIVRFNDGVFELVDKFRSGY